jgi:ABC-2 type transport system ATP-binding protein
MSGLTISHLRKCYGDQTVVDDVSFQVNEREIFGLIGPNGAGKSTSMQMILGLLKGDGGSITLDGQPYDPRNPEMRSRFGVVPQDLAIYPELTAIQNLYFFGKLYGLRGPRLRERVESVLELTGLAQNADHAPRTFSGGMSRRLNFGIALLHEPRYVVLDEPTVGIDPQSRANLLDAIRNLGRKGAGVLYASHYMEEVEFLCDRLAIIDHGRLLRQGTLDQLLDRSRTEIWITTEPLPIDLVAQLKGLAEVQREGDGKMRLVIGERLEGSSDGRPGRLRTALELLDLAKIPVRAMKTQEKSLETLFLSLTGRTLRD